MALAISGLISLPMKRILLSSRRVLRFTFSFDISLPVLFDNAKVTKLTAIFRQ